ncbi:hypothetical protein A4H97_02130 [Niastella yeongjuensis]|uniref:Beta-lactamase-inhibitor-like PepSY-like domain-containing protein n=1 Tax=Niastella yeongjuensis TaxID=354355 RepID=A0A1V9EX03_9BACT|nr:hypothetical protein [Niastella yeongjuensis]OQP50661.1 hypothetical protein A4H97_02130 [Niastella yeongjuensis]SEN23814.1 hypothetical protein SAMN05660816_00518 [Niastella yeongjuensis]
MKNKILIGVFVLLTSISSAFANGKEEVSDRVIKSFEKEFAGAQNVQWTTTKDFVKVTFTLNEQVVYAFYEPNGNLLGVTRNIVSSQLPINLFTDLKKNYNTHWITDLFEMASNHENVYYVTLENSDQKLVLKSNGTTGWEVYSKEKK